MNAQDAYEIAQLYSRYCWAMDHSDGAAFADTFAADGSFVGAGFEFKGSEQLAAFAEGAGLVKRALQHWYCNPVFDRVDDDTVHAKVYGMAVFSEGAPEFGSAGPVIERAGHYRDVIVRTPQGWRFAERNYSDVYPGANAELATTAEEAR